MFTVPMVCDSPPPGPVLQVGYDDLDPRMLRRFFQRYPDRRENLYQCVCRQTLHFNCNWQLTPRRGAIQAPYRTAGGQASRTPAPVSFILHTTACDMSHRPAQKQALARDVGA